MEPLSAPPTKLTTQLALIEATPELSLPLSQFPTLFCKQAHPCLRYHNLMVKVTKLSSWREWITVIKALYLKTKEKEVNKAWLFDNIAWQQLLLQSTLLLLKSTCKDSKIQLPISMTSMESYNKMFLKSKETENKRKRRSPQLFQKWQYYRLLRRINWTRKVVVLIL